MPLALRRAGTTLTRYGGWLPSHPAVHESFIHHHVSRARTKLAAKAKVGHTVPVQAFETAIKNDKEMLDMFNQIFVQASKENKITDFDLLLYTLDHIVEAAPSFHIAEDEQGNPIGEPIGVPMYLLFDLLSNTGAAYDLFRKPVFNTALQNLLNAWGKYLMSEPSNNTLHDGPEGWFSSIALESLEENGRGDFNSTWVIPNPNAVNRGFTSWDHFFTREFVDDKRPLIPPSDPSKIDTILYSACESTVFRIINRKDGGVKEHDQFWLKGQPYSLYDMLGRDEKTARSFIGGSVYQAFLSPQDYHRWRAPVGGVITRADVVPGTYYAVMPDAGAPKDDPDLKPGDPHGAMIRSQAWLTMSSARAVIYIDNPFIGRMCFIAVGMAEVSTCDITVKKGQTIKAGEELGMFHFGGSSHSMIFDPQVDIKWGDQVQIDKHQLVRSVLGEFSKV